MSYGVFVTKDEALEDVRRVADELGRPPKKDEYTALGKYHGDTPSRRCNGWIDALRQAGLDPSEREIEWDPTNLPKENGGHGGNLGHAPNPGTHAHVLDAMDPDEWDELQERRRS